MQSKHAKCWLSIVCSVRFGSHSPHRTQTCDLVSLFGGSYGFALSCARAETRSACTGSASNMRVRHDEQTRKSFGPSTNGPASRCDAVQIVQRRIGPLPNACWKMLRTRFSMIQSANAKNHGDRGMDDPSRKRSPRSPVHFMVRRDQMKCRYRRPQRTV